MRFRLMFGAILAVLAACVLSLGMTSVANAGGGSHSTATSGPGNSGQGCDGSHNSDTGNGANHSGPYDNTCDGSPSGNGNGGNATGKPCAGCVGNADDKNPKGQYPNGSDHNAGYECDRNHGIGRSNPAHTGCKSMQAPPPSTGCTKPKGCDHHGGGGGCGKPEGCDHHGGGGGESTPSKSTETPPGKSETPPATPATNSEHSQAVLGTRTSGQSEGNSKKESGASTPAPSTEVLGESRSGGSGSPAGSSSAPAATTPPASAVQAHAAPAGARGGSLPFTGSDLLVVLLAGCFALLIGFGLRRLLVHRA